MKYFLGIYHSVTIIVYFYLLILVSVSFEQREQQEMQTSNSKDVDTSTTDLPNQWEEDIWSTSEINILRQVFRQAQQENTKLSARLQATEAEYDGMNQKYQKQKLDLDTSTRSLNEIKKVNKRLQIMCENLKASLNHCNKRVNILEEEIVQLKQESMAKSREVQQHKSACDKERLVRKKMQLELKNKNKDMLQEIQLHEDNLRSMHEQDIQIFQRRILHLEDELTKERADHSRNKKGLDVLRTHFASLPYAGESEKKSMITQDELKTWN